VSVFSEKIPSDIKEKILHELQLIEKLKFADYFLTIFEIVEFAKGSKNSLPRPRIGSQLCGLLCSRYYGC